MNKLLLGTTALVGVAFAASAALADSPKVTVGGFSEFQAGIMNDDQDGNRRGHAFRSDNEISFKVDGKTDAGLGYGAEIWLEADTTSDANNQGVNASKTFVYLDGVWGRFEGGSNLGADQTLKIDAATIARATGGIDGDWYYFANNLGGNTFIATPDLPINYGYTTAGGLGDESTENLNKVTYYTPKWYGLQAGISYAPSDQERGQTTTSATRVDNSAANAAGVSQAENILTGGISYSGQWDQVSFGLAATGEMGDAEAAGYEDLQAWNVGAKVGFMGFAVAGSYGDWGDSLTAKGAGADDSAYWTAGASYEFGPFGVSLTYLDSEYDRGAIGSNDFTSWSVGADYKLAPGLTPYVEWTSYDQDAVGGTSTNDNEGHVLLVGSSLNF